MGYMTSDRHAPYFRFNIGIHFAVMALKYEIYDGWRSIEMYVALPDLNLPIGWLREHTLIGILCFK